MNLRDHLEAIKKANGRLTPRLVVDEARDPKHPLHNRFEWNNGIAGESWRREQARQLIKEVEVVYRKADGSQGRVRAFYAIEQDEGYQFESVDELKDDPITREIVLRDMEREWKNLKERYKNFQEFWKLVEAEVTAKGR